MAGYFQNQQVQDQTEQQQELDFQLPEGGFDSYLKGILPRDQAVLAGAFSVAMQQIKNIENVDTEQFSQVAYSIETNNGLPLTNGTDVPVDEFLVDQALTKVSLGSGIYGTYTMSDMMGAMTGLPYPYEAIYEGIKQLQTNNLANIYQNLYLAVSWSRATVSVTCSDDGMGNYTPIGLTLVNPGGGYGREGAPAPVITLSNGGSGTCVIGTNPNNLSTYGKVLSINLTSAGPSALSCPTATVSLPPDNGTGGWPLMNNVVQGYINSANNEIENIQNRNPSNFQAAKVLNANWDITGTALKIEQRSRYISVPPVPVPYDKWLTLYPTALYVFTDAIPDYATQVLPHGPAQSLESIVNLCDTGGQSIVAMMRQERNQARLSEIGIALDNNIPDTLPRCQERILALNGTLLGAADGIQSAVGQYTLPAWGRTQECNGDVLTPIPIASANPDNCGLNAVLGLKQGNISAILNSTDAGPNNNGTGPAVPNNNGTTVPIPTVIVNSLVPIGPSIPLGSPLVAGINRGLGPNALNNLQGVSASSPFNDVSDNLNGILNIGPGQNVQSGISNLGPAENVPFGINNLGLRENLPFGTISNGTVPFGITNIGPAPDDPGLFSGVPSIISDQVAPFLPDNLNIAISSSTLLPSRYNIQDAIDKVIECNCDCWVN